MDSRMSKKSKISARVDSGLVEVKSKFDAEFRRFALNRQRPMKYDDFYKTVEQVHNLQSIPFTITYTDPEGDLLPINNDENFSVAVTTARPLLRLHIERKGQSALELSGYGTAQRRKNKLIKFVPGSVTDVRSPHHLAISMPEDFRRVSAIIDVDIVPACQRRVRLMKSGVDANKPLGFYIRDGTSIRVTANGVEKVPGIFISRLVPGGIAESTGLLAVNDEVLEVNGIEVAGKTLDQVTDMMIANSSNMIITVKPANQNNNVKKPGAPTPSMIPVRPMGSGGSHKSSGSYHSAASGENLDSALLENDEEEDEVTEHIATVSIMQGDGKATRPVGSWDAQETRDSGSRKKPPTSDMVRSQFEAPARAFDGGSGRANGGFGSGRRDDVYDPNQRIPDSNVDSRSFVKNANNNEFKSSQTGVKVMYPVEDL